MTKATTNDPRRQTMDALEFMTALDEYLDARDEWERQNRTGSRVPEQVRRRVGETRTRLIEVVATIKPGQMTDLATPRRNAE